MIEKIKSVFHKMCEVVNILLYIEEQPENNTYCIPCIWQYSGKVSVEAPDFESAKAYVHTHKITPELEDCLCYSTIPDTEHPVLCICGKCDMEYVVSAIHNPEFCPHCGNGFEF